MYNFIYFDRTYRLDNEKKKGCKWAISPAFMNWVGIQSQEFCRTRSLVVLVNRYLIKFRKFICLTIHIIILLLYGPLCTVGIPIVSRAKGPLYGPSNFFMQFIYL